MSYIRKPIAFANIKPWHERQMTRRVACRSGSPRFPMRTMDCGKHPYSLNSDESRRSSP